MAKKYKNRLSNARVTVENKVAPFIAGTMYNTLITTVATILLLAVTIFQQYYLQRMLLSIIQHIVKVLCVEIELCTHFF